ncbi:MAG: MerR family transcriptional regulator [Dehalococcoidia bacterium]|nr:MAG: MerR family transcriptional regulator [Dehalococcoidia bacterium]
MTAEPAGATPKPQRYQIGEVAERTGVTQRTLRFYEEKGLLDPPERMEGGFRLYSEDDINRVTYIRRLQELLGFTLSEIKEMVDAEEEMQQIAATRRPDLALSERVERVSTLVAALSRQLEVIEHKVTHLSAMKEELSAKMTRMQARREELLRQIADERRKTKA